MKIWGLPSNKKDIVTFFQDDNILHKRPVCVSGDEAKLYFGKLKFLTSNIQSFHKKSKYSCWELVFLQLYSLCFMICRAKELISVHLCKK